MFIFLKWKHVNLSSRRVISLHFETKWGLYGGNHKVETESDLYSKGRQRLILKAFKASFFKPSNETQKKIWQGYKNDCWKE